MTHLVRSMDEQASDPSKDEFDSAWQSLRGLLVSEMKRRGLWTSPPTYLGIVGHPYWVQHGIVADALDELTAQCFEFVFVRRHASLHRQAETKPDIDGLVRLNVRHFLLEAQRRNDPLGFRIFEVLRRTVEHGEAERRLFLHRSGRRVDNRTWIAARSDLVPDAASADSSAYEPEPLGSRWTAHYLDELVTSTHGALTRLLDVLSGELAEALGAAGDAGLLRFAALADAVKTPGRAAWADRSLETGSIYTEDSESGIVTPSEEFEQLRRFRRIAACVERSLDDVDERPKTLRYLRRLWRFLHNLSLETHREHPVLDDLEAGELPSHRQLSDLLDIPRERLSGLLETIGSLLRSCRRSLDSSPGSQAMTDPKRPTPRERARASLAQIAEMDGAAKPRDVSIPPRVGEILHLAGVDVDGVFWLVLEIDAAGERSRLAPVDQAALLGPEDVALRRGAGDQDSDADSDWILRAGREAWVPHELLRASATGAAAIDRIDPGTVAEALLHPEDDGTEDGRFRVDAELPAYRDWMEDGPDAAVERLGRLCHARTLPFPAPHESTRPRDRRGRRRPVLWQVLAAALALTALGLVYRLQSAQDEIDRLTTPIVDLPYREIRLSPEPRGEWSLQLPEAADFVQLGLILPETPSADRIRIVLQDSDGRPVFRSEPLAPSREYTVTVARRLAAKPLVVRIVALPGPGDDGDDGEGEDDETVLHEQPIRWTTGTP